MQDASPSIRELKNVMEYEENLIGSLALCIGIIAEM